MEKAPLLELEGKPPKTPLALYLCVLWALPGAFQFGYASGVINDPQDTIKETIGISTNTFALIVAVFAIGGAIGTPLAGKLADRYGRRKFLFYHSFLFLIAGLLEAFCPNLPTPWAWLVLARVMIGFAAGGATVVVPLYIGEVAPKSQRGSLTSLNQFACTAAILVSEIAGVWLSYNPGWRYLLGGTAGIAVLQLLSAPFLPESPKFLVSRRQAGDVQQAQRVLMKLRGYTADMADAEIAELQEASSAGGQAVKRMSVGEIFSSKRLRVRLLVLFTLHASQQLSGINAVFYYSTSLFKSAGITDSTLATLLIGAVNMLATGVGVALMERTGRRPLIVYGALIMLVSSVCLTVFLALGHNGHGGSVTGLFAVAFIMVYVAGFEVGLGPIPWAIGTEVFEESERATAMGIGASLNWFCNFVVGYAFPSINDALFPYSFLPFSAVLLVCFLITYTFFVETKGKTIEEVADEYTGRSGGGACTPSALQPVA